MNKMKRSSVDSSQFEVYKTLGASCPPPSHDGIIIGPFLERRLCAYKNRPPQAELYPTNGHRFARSRAVGVSSQTSQSASGEGLGLRSLCVGDAMQQRVASRVATTSLLASAARDRAIRVAARSKGQHGEAPTGDMILTAMVCCNLCCFSCVVTKQ